MENMNSQAPLPIPGQQVMVLMRDGNTYHSEIKTIQETKTGKTAIYCRTASTHPNDFGTIWIQRDKVRAFAFEQGYCICEVYSDDGYSGNNLNRPAFAKMEADIEAGKIDTIIVSCASRIARDTFLLEDWREKARAKGVKLIALDGSHEYPNFIKEIRSLIHGKKHMAM